MSDKIDTQKIAKLARLKLTEIESDKLDGYLEQVVDYIDQLKQLDTSNVQPTSHVLPVHNVFRDDKAPGPQMPTTGTTDRAWRLPLLTQKQT